MSFRISEGSEQWKVDRKADSRQQCVDGPKGKHLI